MVNSTLFENQACTSFLPFNMLHQQLHYHHSCPRKEMKWFHYCPSASFVCLSFPRYQKLGQICSHEIHIRTAIIEYLKLINFLKQIRKQTVMMSNIWKKTDGLEAAIQKHLTALSAFFLFINLFFTSKGTHRQRLRGGLTRSCVFLLFLLYDCTRRSDSRRHGSADGLYG